MDRKPSYLQTTTHSPLQLMFSSTIQQQKQQQQQQQRFGEALVTDDNFLDHLQEPISSSTAIPIVTHPESPISNDDFSWEGLLSSLNSNDFPFESKEENYHPIQKSNSST